VLGVNRKKYKATNKLLQNSLWLIVLCMLLFLTVGYSAFSQKLLIGDVVATVNPDENVMITSFGYYSATNNGSSSEIGYSISAVSGNLSLPNSNSTVTYIVKVKNFGNVEMGISNIALPSELDSILDVSVSDYTIGTKLRDNGDTCENSSNGCKLSIKRTFYITVKYDSGAYNSTNTTFNNFRLDFTFAQAYKVTYTGFTNPLTDINAYSALKGTTYNYNIGDHKNITIKMAGVNTTNYTIDSGNNLSIPNVTGDIEVIQQIPVKINVDPSNAIIKYTINGGSEQTATGTLNTTVSPGSTLIIKSITATASDCGYTPHPEEKFENIQNDIDETITLSKYYNVSISTNPSASTITYNVNGGAHQTTTSTLSGQYAPGTVITVVSVSKSGYITSTSKTYTINEHTTDTITLTPNTYSYTLNVTNVTPKTITLTSTTATQGCSNTNTCTITGVVSGTQVQYNVVADYYKDPNTKSAAITSNSSDSITLSQKDLVWLSEKIPTSGSNSWGGSVTLRGADRGDGICDTKGAGQERWLQYNFDITTNDIPSDAQITSIFVDYKLGQVNIGGNMTATAVFSCGSQQLGSLTSTVCTSDDCKFKSITASNLPSASTIIDNNFSLKITYAKKSALSAGWYCGAEVNIQYRPK